MNYAQHVLASGIDDAPLWPCRRSIMIRSPTLFRESPILPPS